MKINGIQVHSKKTCVKPCPFHAPSNHPLNKALMTIRVDKNFLVERICEHGVGHDDPDSTAWFHKNGKAWVGVHGCDGCCSNTLDITEPINVMPEPLKNIPIVHSDLVRSKKTKTAFITYLAEHPDERFWQAVRNFSGEQYILTATKNSDESWDMLRDTFHKEEL